MLVRAPKLPPAAPPPEARLPHRFRPLRTSEAEKAAEYQRLALGREELDREEARVTDALTQLANRQNQLTQDIARETSLLDDAKSAVARLAEEAESLAVQIAEASPKQAAAKDVLEAARLTASQNEANLAEASAALRAAATTRDSLASRKQDIENRIQVGKCRAGAIVA
jgi:chromosome segregation protein